MTSPLFYHIVDNIDNVNPGTTSIADLATNCEEICQSVHLPIGAQRFMKEWKHELENVSSSYNEIYTFTFVDKSRLIVCRQWSTYDCIRRSLDHVQKELENAD